MMRFGSLCSIPLLGLIGCADSPPAARPDAGLRISTQTFVREVREGRDGAGHPVLQCIVEVQATATGSPDGGAARWRSGVFRVYRGVDRSAPSDSTLIPEEEMPGRWGGATLGNHQVQRMGWTVSGLSLPAEGEFVFRYLANGQERWTEPTRFACGPQPVPGAAGPSAGSLTLPDGVDEAALGQTVAASYSVTAPAGLWFSWLEVTGAYADSVVTVPTPLGTPTPAAIDTALFIDGRAAVGERVVVRAAAMDLAGRVAYSVATIGPAAVDRTPPVLSRVLFPTRMRLASGDSIPIRVEANDPAGVITHLLYRLTSETATRLDSIPFATWGTYRFPTGRADPRPATLTLWARDRGGNRSAPRSSAEGHSTSTRAWSGRCAPPLPCPPEARSRWWSRARSTSAGRKGCTVCRWAPWSRSGWRRPTRWPASTSPPTSGGSG